ncbi:MAG: rod shape-determining protein MreC [Brevundimonas sp.]|uniref:rod shape-determining protein MreC n=1 Tax=Brevundimonas sp. TaxID=1871086 RepID=UPI001A187339|nr:rod shape-determining protein MreC [Brevundimonas sp.]MBJ7447344.1 rod shape-determining protein MreC [Brevundimonas sp.]
MAFRDGPFENIKVPVVWTAAVALVVCAIGASLLLISDAHGEATYRPVRSGVESTAGAVGGVLAAPVRWFGSLGDGISGYFFAVSENRRLKAEHVELLRLRDENTALRIENARYETLLAIRPDPPVAMVTGRAISDARGPFSNARLIDVGSAKGVKIGQPVVNEQGLLGRVVGTSGNVSRLLLLTDVASRTPVMIQRTDARALLTGDGSGNPRLEFVRGVGSVQVGDRILSSGDGGAFPRGVPVGVVAKGLDGSWRVKLFSDRGPIDYVRVMLFQDFGQLVGPHELDAPPLAGLTPVPRAVPAPAAPAPSTPAPETPAPATGGPG